MNEYSPPPDHVRDEDEGRAPSLEENVKSGATWLRLFFMLVMLFIYGVSRVVLGAVVLIQFLFVLFKGETNEPLRALGQSLAIYTYQIVRYLTFNTEKRPFPFDREWPTEAPDVRASE